MECPVTCPCRRSAGGAFLLAGCVWTALWSRLFLGGDFGALVAALLRPPHAVAPALVLWCAIAAAGLWLALTGIRPALEEGDAAPWWRALAAAALGIFATHRGWHLPEAWGVQWVVAGRGFVLSATAAAAATVCLALGARAWMMGFVAAGGERFAAADWQNTIQEQEHEIALLRTECTRAIEDRHDIDTLLHDPLVKKSVLKALHPDAHPDAGDAERRALTERFQRAAGVFDRFGDSP
jgi:hypothetical protein